MLKKIAIVAAAVAFAPVVAFANPEAEAKVACEAKVAELTKDGHVAQAEEATKFMAEGKFAECQQVAAPQ